MQYTPPASVPKIDSLTPEQNVKLREYREKWEAISRSTKPTYKKRGEKALATMYQMAGLPVPTFVWCESPHEANLKINAELGTPGDKMTYKHTTLWGSLDAYWICFYLFCRDVLKVPYSEDKSKSLDLWADVAKSHSWWYPYDTHCFICEKPKYVNMDKKGRFHSHDEPALGFKGNWSVYAVGGVIVEDWVVKNPEQINARTIAAEPKEDVKAAMRQQKRWFNAQKRKA